MTVVNVRLTTKKVRNLYSFATAWRAEDNEKTRRLQAEFDRWLAQYEADLRERIANDIEALPDAYIPSVHPGISLAGYVDKRLPILIARGKDQA